MNTKSQSRIFRPFMVFLDKLGRLNHVESLIMSINAKKLFWIGVQFSITKHQHRWREIIKYWSGSLYL